MPLAEGNFTATLELTENIDNALLK